MTALPRHDSTGSDWPLITVGIPTFNRAASLRKALDSALAQTYPNLEIIVSDNASTDATPELLRAYSTAHPRLRVIRQPANLGSVGNFEAVFRASAGRWYMWLADDDWLDPGYIAACAKALQAQPAAHLVCGISKYYRNDSYLFDGVVINLDSPDPSARVLEYYNQVKENGTFYGVARREILEKIPFTTFFGGDWMFVADIAFLGHVRTLSHVAIHRDFTWDEKSFERIAHHQSLPAIQARFPYLSIALSAYYHVSQLCPVYQSLASPARKKLAQQVWRILCRRHGVKFKVLCRAWMAGYFRSHGILPKSS